MFTLINGCLRSSSHRFQFLPQKAQLIGRYRRSATLYSDSIRSNSSNSAAYKGDGKTTVRVLNDEESHLNLVNTYSENGFRLHNKLFIYGSILLFPTNVFSWNVKRAKDITIESLMIFDIIVPKTKIVIIGYGQYGEDYDASIPIQLKKKGISCEMLATPNAVTTYNYLVHDSVHVAGAFIPMKDAVKQTSYDVEAMNQYDTVFGTRPYVTEQTFSNRVLPHEEKELYMKTVYRDTEKKEFSQEDLERNKLNKQVAGKKSEREE